MALDRKKIILISTASALVLLGAFLFGKIERALSPHQNTGQERTPVETALGIPAQTSKPSNPAPKPSTSSTPAPAPSQPSQTTSTVLLNVPFTPQAPTGDWADPRQQSGCEEAGALMAVDWAEGKTMSDAQTTEQKIIDISNYEQATYGDYHDTNVKDTIIRIYEGYFHYNKVEARYNITAGDIKVELSKGNVVLVPTNGQKLNNPYYNPPGPLQHELVIKGYDDSTHEFITNDPGTRHGNSYRYPMSVVMNAIYDYATGDNEPIGTIVKAMIVVSR